MNYLYILAGSVMLFIGIFLISGGSRVIVAKKLFLGPGRGHYWPFHYSKEMYTTTDRKAIIWNGCTYLFLGIFFTVVGAIFFMVGIDFIQF